MSDFVAEKNERERVRAAIQGVANWGAHGSASMHRRYVVEGPRSRRRKCVCGKRATHVGMANGVALMSGCEWCAHRWVRVVEVAPLDASVRAPLGGV